MPVDDGVLKDIFELSKTAVVITDMTGTVRYLNAAFERLTGYGHSDMVGEGIDRFGGMSDAQRQGLWQRLREGRSWRGEFLTTRKCGERIGISASINPFKHPTSGEVCLLGLNREVSLVEESVAMLTRRERDVLELIVAGLRDSDIGKELGITSRTVGHHVGSILRKLDVPNRTVAATRARHYLDKHD